MKRILFCLLISSLLLGIFLPVAASNSSDVQPGHESIDPAGHGTWTFVVFGDSRDNMRDSKTGISPDLRTIATSIAADNPDLVIFSGDLINGWFLEKSSPVAGDYETMFKNWMDAVSPIHDYTTGKGVPLYVVRGNHEDGEGQTIQPLLKAYLDTVAADMPKNGPAGEEQLSYVVTWKGAKFIGVDEYLPHDGLKATVNQDFVDEQLTHDSRQFTFIFGHAPAYLIDDDKDEKGWDLTVHPEKRDIFWKSLVSHHVLAYLCGHAHTYVRGEKDGVQQILSGNGGALSNSYNLADADPNLTIEYPRVSLEKKDMKVGYVRMTVHEDTGICDGVQRVYNTETKDWEDGDVFSLKG